MSRKSSKIIWAVDPFEEEGALHGAKVLAPLARKLGAELVPVHVLSDGLVGLSVPPRIFVANYAPLAEAALERELGRRGVPEAREPKLLVRVPSSRGEAVAALDRFARSQGAALIFVNSHGRSGLKRALLGSFAETLVLHSRTPVLLSGPLTRPARAVSEIVFPTDLSRASAATFEQVLGLARRLGARLTILHVVPDPAASMIQSGAALLGGGYVALHGFVRRTGEEQTKKAQSWVEKARKAGVRAQAIVDLDSRSVAVATVSLARKKKAGLIAMCSQSSAFSAAVLGSIGREVARQAPCPVLFFRASRARG